MPGGQRAGLGHGRRSPRLSGCEIEPPLAPDHRLTVQRGARPQRHAGQGASAGTPRSVSGKPSESAQASVHAPAKASTAAPQSVSGTPGQAVTRVAAPVTDGTFEFTSRWQMTAPQLRAYIPGTSLALAPYYEPLSPVFADKGTRLTAVDAGTSAAPDFRGTRGKLAVVRYDTVDNSRELAQTAAAAGAKALLLVWPEGLTAWTRWQPDGDRMALPVIRTSWTHGTAFLQRAKKHTTTVEFSGTVRSPYLYDVMQISKGSIPKKLVHTVSERESAVVHTTYTRTGASAWASEQRFGWRP
ncbi:hypothetical protein [Streptomyces sp. NPDC056192]|uniref:hypothetical protein n=1 Tax=Streptomyces sp. NPDC056192 TaxID=3345743 RepID=UPI0035D8188F